MVIKVSGIFLFHFSFLYPTARQTVIISQEIHNRLSFHEKIPPYLLFMNMLYCVAKNMNEPPGQISP